MPVFYLPFPRGFTLTEIVVIVAILSLLAGVFAPNFAPARLSQLEIASSELINAINFAKNEAVRTRTPHGIDINPSDLLVRVFQFNTDINPPERLYTVRDPLTKNLYSIDFAGGTMAKVSSITITTTFQNNCNQTNHVVFDENGMPYCTNPYGVLLLSSDIDMTLDQHTQTISILPGKNIIQ